jgi:bidirectional [NiFe] hydrogenase diaphorase subunit
VTGERVDLTIDGRPARARPGDSILFAARDAGVWIPALCARRGQHPPFGACRLCWVEVEGLGRPVTSCTTPVAEGMVVRTRSEAVDRLVRGGFELLMSHHDLECRRCPANHACSLQDIARARKLKLRPKRVPRLERREAVDDSHPALRYDPTKCVLCGLCVWACQDHGLSVLDFARRGLETLVSTAGGRPLAETSCDGCRDCVRACPVGALSGKGQDGPGAR